MTSAMKALLLVAHGSNSIESNREIEGLISRLEARCEGLFIRHAFLELVSPSVSSAVARLREEGVSEISVFPYFLAGGRHVAHDLPESLAKERAKYPGLSIRELPHLGADPEFVTWLVEKVRDL